MDSTAVSLVIPTFNEEESLTELAQKIAEVCGSQSIDFEIIFVDDGSSDRSWSVISELAAENQRISGIRFRRNFGKAAALSAGIAASRGEIIITMDADLQDDPREIPRFLEKLESDFDVVSGWKKVRHDPWHKRLPSLVFNQMVSSLTKVRLHDHNCGFKAYRRGVFDSVELYGERHRFIPVLAASQGWRVGEIEVTHHARKFGHSKYGLSRLVKGFLDLIAIYLITGFSGRPFHLIGTAGLACFGLGGAGMIYLSIVRLLSHRLESMEDIHLHQTAIFYYCILAVILGAQFFLAGLLAELMVSRTMREADHYCISEQAGRVASHHHNDEPGEGPMRDSD